MRRHSLSAVPMITRSRRTARNSRTSRTRNADQSTSTNTDIFVVSVAGGEPKRITLGTGADRSPVYSPDGKYLAFRSQARAGMSPTDGVLVLFERSSGRTTIV